MADSRNMKPGWRVWRFDQMAVSVNDRVEPGDVDVDYYVGLEHLDPDSLKIRRWGAPSDISATKLLFRKGDIIFGRHRVYQRKLGIAEFDGICSAHAMVLRPKTDVVLPEFLPFFMQSDLFMNRALEISVGSLSPTINWRTLAKQEFALPPLEEQQQYVEYLLAVEDLLEAYMQLQKSLNQTRISLVSEIAMRATDSVRFNKEAKISRGWELKTIQDICSHVIDCLHRTPEYIDKGIPAIRTTDVNDGELNINEAYRVSSDEYEVQISRLEPIQGDILFSREAPMGQAALVPKDTKLCISQRMMHLRCKTSAVPEYVMELLNSQYVSDQVDRFATGTTVRHINVADVRKLLIPITDQKVQADFADKISTCRDGMSSIRTRIFQLNQLKALLLADSGIGDQRDV